MSSGSALNLLKTLLFLLLEFPVRPRWAYYRLRGFLYGHVLNRYHRARIQEYQPRIMALHEALSHVTGRDLEDVVAAARGPLLDELVVEGRWVVALRGFGAPPELEAGPITKNYGPSPELMIAVNTVCNLLEPEQVIETGVAKGFTSIAILESLDRRGKGHLTSVEMPSLYLGYREQVGALIPERLRKRWTLRWGPSALVLPPLVRRLGAFDVFVYDSAASYDNQLAECRAALAGLRPGGVLIADLLETDAFLEVAEAARCRWAAIEQSKSYPIGVLAKLP